MWRCERRRNKMKGRKPDKWRQTVEFKESKQVPYEIMKGDQRQE